MVLCLLAPAAAQVISGVIVGTVVDPSDAVVSGAQVTLTNEQTNLTFKTLTDASGNYVVPNLPLFPDLYGPMPMGGLPRVAISFLNAIGDYGGDAGLKVYTDQIMDHFTHVRGRHTMKAGIDIGRYRFSGIATAFGSTNGSMRATSSCRLRSRMATADGISCLLRAGSRSTRLCSRTCRSRRRPLSSFAAKPSTRRTIRIWRPRAPTSACRRRLAACSV